MTLCVPPLAVDAVCLLGLPVWEWRKPGVWNRGEGTVAKSSKSLKSGERGETESLFLVFLGQEPAGPIPTARPHLLSLPCTRPAATLGLGLRCPAVKRRRVPERQPGLGPLPLTQSRTRQSRIPEHICQSGCWPVGLLGGENPSLPVFWPRETCGGCWTGLGRRATSRFLTVANPSWVRSGGGEPAGSPPCPKAPQWLEVGFSPG